jgi:hypothetical protein
MTNGPRVPKALLRELAVRASVDPRTVMSVLRDPASASRHLARRRAERVLREEGLLGSSTFAPPPEAA